MQNTVAVNYAGNPALAVPIPLKDQTIPVTSLQLVGPRMSEAGLLNVGRLIEAEFERQALGKASLEGGLQGVVVRDAFALDIADATQIRKLSAQRACSATGIGDWVEWRGLIDAVDRFWQVLPDVADVAYGEDVGTKLLLNL